MSIKKTSDVNREDIQRFEERYFPNSFDISALNEDVARAGLIVLNQKIKELKSFLVASKNKRDSVASDK
jgi:hypothetical protein